ncbi:Conidial development protein fluffy like [Verticillium longisporum]|uniref:Conidial development protein fluffy like n=1 Tax=Verticillium longisporum TaxID=100787 RepID=A0A8I3A155_VERLO|nr:Conidial development protein fluffy like [Verticillium longisporum]
MSSPSTNRKPRVCTREACEPCRKGRSKCDGQTPCARCSSRGLECEYQARIHRSKRSLRDEIEVLKQRQREQDALLEALQDPLRRDAALRMLQERSRVAVAMNDNELGQQQTDMTIKQEERRHSDVSSWNNFDDMRASSGSPLQGFTPSSTTRPMVSTTPQMSWTTTGPCMRPDTSVTSGMETGAFQAPATTAAFADVLAALDGPVAGYGRSRTSAAATTTRQSPVNSRTNSSSTTASSGTTQSSAPSMTSATASVGGLPFSPSMKPPPPVSFFEPVDESGRRQSMPDRSTVTADTAPIESADARERHRIASARSWSKQKSAIADLQATVSRVEAQHAALRQEYTQVLNQVHDVHNALLKHVGCNDPAISMWLKQDQEASTAGMSREKPGPPRPTTNEFVAEFSHDAF